MRRILLIDDNADLREIARLSLELTGDVSVVVAASGREGVEQARSEPPDAILLDVNMPDLDGPETLALLREDARTADVPVILLTAKVQPSDRREYDVLDVAGVLEKPFDPVRISGDVARLLGWA